MKVKTKTKPIDKVKDQCWGLIHKTKLAFSRGEFEQVSIDLRRMIKKAIAFDLLQPVAIMSQDLSHYYYNVEKHKSLGKKYFEIAKKFRKLTNLEANLLIELQPIRYSINKKMKPSSDQMNELKAFVEKVEPWLSYQSPTLSAHIYQPTIAYYHQIGQIQKAVSYCDAAIEQLKPLGWEHSFYYTKAHIELENEAYENSQKAIISASAIVGKTSINWYYYRLMEIKICLYAGHYEEALQLFEKTNWRLSKDPKIIEYSYILKGYLNFLIPELDFKLGRYLNEVVIFKGDKAGLNISTLIIYFLYYLRRDRARLIDEYDAIECYARRNCQGRSRLFLKILCAFIKYGFKPDVIELRMSKDIKQLNDQKPNIDIEFLKYEKILNLIYHECDKALKIR
jgi:hypothetical protein